MTGPKVVIVGAGVVGAALADEVTAQGWTDVTVLDQGDLPVTGGSTSHAPGLVFQASPSKTLTDFARYTVEKFCDLTLDGESCFYQVGGLEVALTPERLDELHRRCGWLTSWGIEAQMLDGKEAADKHSLLDAEQVVGGLFTPTDGLARAVNAVQVQLQQAADRGATLLGRHEVLDVIVEDGVTRGVMTNEGQIDADIVVCCAGIWGPKVAAMVGLTLPLTPLGHQMGWTAPVPALAGATREATLPILRHQGQDLYYREKFDTIGIGYYGHRAMPMDATDIAAWTPDSPMPSVLQFTPDDFAPAWKESQNLLPGLRDTTIESGFNGLFSFTTDGMPLIGQAPDAAGFWVAEAVWVTHSAGVGRAVAELLVDGVCSTFDLHECDLRRFEPHQTAPDYVLARDCRNFDEVYDILHPLQPPEDLRPLRVSPFYRRQQELGAEFLEASGWERPQWYDTNKDLVDGADIPELGAWASRYWSPIVAAEAQETRKRVAMYDMTALKRLEVTGPGATTFLQNLVTANIAKSVGAVTYCLMLDYDGGVRSDITVARLGANHYQVGANGNADLAWMQKHLPQDGSAHVSDITPGTCCIGLWGPMAREVLQPLTTADLGPEGLKYFRSAQFFVGPVAVTALRMSYVGELGWELYTTADQGEKLWDLLWAAGQDHGLIAAGRGAFASLRLEKGYRSYGSDMTAEHDPYQAGLGFAVRADRDFIGKEALLARKDDAKRKLVCLVFDNANDTVLGKEPVYDGEHAVGYVTSASYGFTIGAGIAYAWVTNELAEVGTQLQIGYFDQRLAATVTAEPIVDPKMTRLRG